MRYGSITVLATIPVRLLRCVIFVYFVLDLTVDSPLTLFVSKGAQRLLGSCSCLVVAPTVVLSTRRYIIAGFVLTACPHACSYAIFLVCHHKGADSGGGHPTGPPLDRPAHAGQPGDLQDSVGRVPIFQEQPRLEGGLIALSYCGIVACMRYDCLAACCCEKGKPTRERTK